MWHCRPEHCVPLMPLPWRCDESTALSCMRNMAVQLLTHTMFVSLGTTATSHTHNISDSARNTLAAISSAVFGDTWQHKRVRMCAGQHANIPGARRSQAYVILDANSRSSLSTMSGQGAQDEGSWMDSMLQDMVQSSCEPANVQIQLKRIKSVAKRGDAQVEVVFSAVWEALRSQSSMVRAWTRAALRPRISVQVS